LNTAMRSQPKCWISSRATRPLPLNKMPDWYPDMVRAPYLWGLSFKMSDGRRRARAITASMWPYVGRAVRALVKNHPADLIVTVHALATTVILKALGRNRPPFIIVVTDMVSTHALWYDQRADLILVPTEMARQRAIAYEMDPDQVRVVGQPVAERYCAPVGDKKALREKLGWEQDKTIILLVGGGEGMGPLGKTAREIAASGLDVALAIVCGRNQRLKKHLESLDWSVPVHIYGFTRDLPDFMRAADVLVTKAGPGTIAESLNAYLPMILYARLPGQEDGNVAFVVEEKVGVWAPQPELVVQTLREWVRNPEVRSAICGKLSPRGATGRFPPDRTRHRRNAGTGLRKSIGTGVKKLNGELPKNKGPACFSTPALFFTWPDPNRINCWPGCCANCPLLAYKLS
jgi:1,2-diacylglycerol 3-beta-galactosyltransferase